MSRTLIAAACSTVVIAASGCSDNSGPGAARDRSPGEAPAEIRARGVNASESRYRAELAMIEHAQQPEELSPESVVEQLRRATKVRSPGGGTYYVYPPKREPTATAPVRGCSRRAPQPPGVTARRIAPTKVLVTYRIAGGDEDCRAEWIGVTADVSDDFLGGDGKRYPIATERAGQIVLPLSGHVVDADILVASTRTKENSGFASRTTTIRIR